MLEIIPLLLILTQPVPMCSPGVMRTPFRHDTASYFVATATRDSVYVGNYVWGTNGVTKTAEKAGQSVRAVYGQVAIVSNRGRGGPKAPRIGEKVLLVWWTFGASCDRYFPSTALKLPAGADVFISRPILPKSQWVQGFPTIDANMLYWGRHGMYSPLLEPRIIYYGGAEPRAIDPISAHDYARMFAALPLQSELGDAPYMKILNWVKQNPSLADKYPVSEMAHIARMGLGLK